MNDMNRNFLLSPSVQAVCDAQRLEAQAAKNVLEEIERLANKLGHFYMELGHCRNSGGCIEFKAGRWETSRWEQDSRWRDPERVDSEHPSLQAALDALLEEK